MEERTLVLCPDIEVDGNVTKDFLETFAILDADDGPIKVIICSDGGSYPHGLAIYEAIRQSRNFVTTHAMGSASSIAVLILQAGDKRLISENTVLWLHEVQIHFEGGKTQLQAIAVETERLNAQYCDLLSKRSGVDKTLITAMCHAETTVLAKEALAVGLVDGVVVDMAKPVKLGDLDPKKSAARGKKGKK